MSARLSISDKQQNVAVRHPVTSYFLLAFAVSWAGALAVAASHLLRHESLSSSSGIQMFPIMLLGSCVSGVVLTFLVDGKRGLAGLWSRMSFTGFRPQWYAAVLIPPTLVLAVLLFLKTCISPAYSPNYFFLGFFFGVPAGFVEEIGWIGYAFPKMLSAAKPLLAAIVLGLLWSAWHLPVINFLGTVTPHGAHWLSFFFAFTFVMTAMRVLIAWIYMRTRSVLLSQLLHASSTASLVVFGAPRVSAGQEVSWYAIYGLTLWCLTGALQVYGFQSQPEAKQHNDDIFGHGPR
jgi:membrane protease YdiL (CAAX protease family)